MPRATQIIINATLNAVNGQTMSTAYSLALCYFDPDVLHINRDHQWAKVREGSFKSMGLFGWAPGPLEPKPIRAQRLQL